MIKAWFQKEQAARFPKPPALTGIVFVRRPPAALPDIPQGFEAYAPGAEVVQVEASLDATNPRHRRQGRRASRRGAVEPDVTDRAAPRGLLGRHKDRLFGASIGE